MRTGWKFALSVVLASLAFLSRPPESIALCTQDTYCQYFTDGTLSNLCGERQTCVYCGTENWQWGCVSSPYKWCQTFGACGAGGDCWTCMILDGFYQCFGSGCPPGP